MSEEVTTPVPGAAIIDEVPPAPPVEPEPEMPTVPGWTEAVCEVRRNKAESFVKRITRSDYDRFVSEYGAANVIVMEVAP